MTPFFVTAYIEELETRLSPPSVKQNLPAILMLFDDLVTGQVVPVNPAASVRGPKYVVKRGKPRAANFLRRFPRSDTAEGYAVLYRRGREQGSGAAERRGNGRERQHPFNCHAGATMPLFCHYLAPKKQRKDSRRFAVSPYLVTSAGNRT